ncbi:MarR family winged helix-turn-helix transcriptional regulator [Mycolicibacterium sp. CH28]|uniref:MarR family winged helix-turn-helix transcriptional regulator n=1 Tax=Mycolicibacterium sp. CH28 TaxID=2512237 RepID=UPI001F2DB72F|nr:MarR family transcriptional regulator [Mycolicibacterium sp. CH28]
MVRAFDERLGDHGVSTPRSKVLFLVERLGPVRLTDLARAVGITQGTASTLADALVRDGLIERCADDSDRRVTLLQTTPTGRRQAQSWGRDYAAAAGELLDFFSDDEKELLTQLLHRLADSIDS